MGHYCWSGARFPNCSRSLWGPCNKLNGLLIVFFLCDILILLIMSCTEINAQCSGQWNLCWAAQCIFLRVLGKNCEHWAGLPSTAHHGFNTGSIDISQKVDKRIAVFIHIFPKAQWHFDKKFKWQCMLFCLQVFYWLKGGIYHGQKLPSWEDVSIKLNLDCHIWDSFASLLPFLSYVKTCELFIFNS